MKGIVNWENNHSVDLVLKSTNDESDQSGNLFTQVCLVKIKRSVSFNIYFINLEQLSRFVFILEFNTGCHWIVLKVYFFISHTVLREIR